MREEKRPSSRMDAEVEARNAFDMYRPFLWILGVWPLEEKNAFQIFRFCTACLAQITFAIHTTTELYLNTGKISAMVDVVLFCSSAYLTLVKQGYLKIYQKLIIENMKSYRDDWMNAKDENVLKIMRDHVKVYRYQFIAYNSAGYIGTTMFLIRTIVTNFVEKRYHFDGNGTFEYQFVCQTSYLSGESLARYYELILCVQYLQCLYCCTSGACTDCFFLGLVLHLSAQFEILALEWRKLTIEEVGKSRTRQRRRFVELVRRHKHLVGLAENLEKSFNRTLLIQLVNSIVLVCMSGCSVLVSLIEKDYMTMLMSVNCICFMMTESFIYGYGSDYLLTRSEDVVRAVYSSDWYLLDESLRRNVVLVMMKAQKPLQMTAGKFFYVTRNTIVQLLKTSFSFLSVLRLTLERSDL